MNKNYRVELAVCLDDQTWEPQTVEIALSSDGGRGPTEGEIWEAAHDQFHRKQEQTSVVAVGLLYSEEIQGFPSDLWRRLGDDMPCPQCGEHQIETQDGVTLCHQCGWQAANPGSLPGGDDDQ